jgi:spermidine/putrescine transport system permease protein
MRRRVHPFIAAIGGATIGFLYLPLLAITVWSFNDSRGLAWQGATVSWYGHLVADFPDSRIDRSALFGATGNTLLLAVISTAIATMLGTLLALGMRSRWPNWARSGIEAAVMLPVVSPDIIIAAALIALRQTWGWFGPGMTGMVIGHVTFQISFVTLVVRARLSQLGVAQEEAARDLYADNLAVVRRVLLPQLWPAIAAGAMLAFTLSLDDFVISFFMSSPTSTTLPLLIQASIKRGLAPEISALSTLILLATVLLVLAGIRLHRRSPITE